MPADTTKTGPVLQQVIEALLTLEGRERQVVLTAARMYFFQGIGTSLRCICIGGLYDRTCPVHGPLSAVPRGEHQSELTTLKNQLSQLETRVRTLEGARPKCTCSASEVATACRVHGSGDVRGPG